MKIYYCDCGKSVRIEDEEGPKKCNCGKIFGSYSGSHLNYINMHKTLSRTTKVEFNTTTMDKTIKEMNNG